MNRFSKIAMCSSLALLGAFTLFGCGEKDNNIYVSTQAELIEAVSTATEENKIVLTNSIDLNQTLVVTTTITLDLNEFELYNTTDIWNDETDNWSLISVQDNGNLTITGNGKVNAKENDCFAFDVRDNARCTINNGEIIGNITAVYAIDNATVTIEGGKFDIKQLSEFNDNRYLLNILDKDKNTASFIVKGGTFTNYDPSNSSSENPIKNFVAEGYKSVKNGNNYIVSKIEE